MAFWNRKAEANARPAIDEKTLHAIEVAANFIDLQLLRARDVPGLNELFFCPFVRGYLSGAFMGSMQAFKIPGYGDSIKTMAFLVGGHIHIMGEEKGFTYAMDALRYKGDHNFDFGNRTGGKELIDWLNRDVIMPTQLYDFLRGI